MNLENIVVIERSEIQKAIYYMSPLRIDKLIETESRLGIAKGCSWE